MIAEIKGKISRTSSNLSDRLEDDLTGNFFGSLRYIPFDLAMKQIICNAVYPRSISDTVSKINAGYWADKIEFWPYHSERELDAFIDFDDVAIGIEVKYKSGISSDDNVDNSALEDLTESEEEIIKEESIQQLAREARIVSSFGQDKDKILILVADSSSCRDIYEDTIKRQIIKQDVTLGCITWQQILQELKKLCLVDDFHSLIVSDLISLLIRKDFEQFENMAVNLMDFVEPLQYFIFNYIIEASFNFNINNIVKEDVYYEFK